MDDTTTIPSDQMSDKPIDPFDLLPNELVVCMFAYFYLPR